MSDLARFVFERTKRYVAVLLQQGRVLLDSDWSELGRRRRKRRWPPWK